MGAAKIKKPVRDGKLAKTPVVMQMEALECGAASLAMILAYYGKWVSLEKVRSDCGVSRNGSNAKNLILAARAYGLHAQGFQYEPEELRAEGSFPCVIHWNFNHFVVLNGFRGERAYLNDPARGAIDVSMEEFDQAFTGICLEFEPGEQFTPGGKQSSIWDFARERTRGMSVAVAFVILTMAISSLTGILKSGFSRIFLDQLLPGRYHSWLIPFLVGLVLLSIVQIVVEWMKAIYALRIDGKMAAAGSTAYMWRVLHLPLEFFSQRLAGDIQSRIHINASASSTLVNTLAPLLVNTVMMIVYLVIMLRYSLPLTLVGLISIAVNLLISRLISEKRVNLTRVLQRDKGKLSAATVSGIEMIETLKSAGAENGFFEKWAGYQASVNTQRVRYAEIEQYFGLFSAAASQVVNIAVLTLGVWFTIEGEFTVGMILAFQGFLSAFTAPAESLISAGQTIQEMRTDMERVQDVMKYPVDGSLDAEAPEEDDQPYDKLKGNLEMRGVTFGYSRLAPPLIEGFDLNVTQGSRIALVGPSGCGKSTLSNLISGLYRPWSGEILFDGKPISAYNRPVFTGSVAVVDQDIVLFEDTIANNIKMWDSSIEDYEMIYAARDAQLHEDIMQRDGDYQYKLAEGGRDLSGGQRQRMEIARVLAQDPTIIILDEATSALDAKTESDVMRSISDRGITCIVIAHRLSTIRDCDEILVLDRGKVVERGTHDELMAKNGMYSQLVTSE